MKKRPAPDGEEYFVMSLYFASGRWGNGAGDIQLSQVGGQNFDNHATITR